MNRLPNLLAATLIAGVSGFGAQAAPIHKWVDDKGVTHYSDLPPDAATVPVTQVDIETHVTGARTPARVPDDYYSIANQWQRMNQERQQREQRELQRAANTIEAQALRNPVAPVAEPEPEYRAAVYPRRWHRRHGYKHRRHHVRGGMNVKHPPVRAVSSGFPSVIN